MKYMFKLNAKKCVACGACVVACMDQNDTNPQAGEKGFRRVSTVEHHNAPSAKTAYLSLGCMHCADAPCIKACPSGCLYKNDVGLTLYDNSSCIGCQKCLSVCPFGAPTFGADGKMQKCDGCCVRLENGLLPACVRVCPTGALSCEPSEA